MSKPLKCSRCGKNYRSRESAQQHIDAKHAGKGRVEKNGPVEHEPSMADLFIEAQLNRAMGIPNEDWIEEMLP